MTRLPLFRNHFQMGYVARDVKAASENLSEKFGVTKWRIMEMPEQSDIKYVGLAYVQNTMIELLEIKSDRDTIFNSCIPEEKTEIKFHHLGYLIESREEWNTVSEKFKSAGFNVALLNDTGDLQLVYHDTVAALGHYCELIHLGPEGKSFLDAPHN